MYPFIRLLFCLILTLSSIWVHAHGDLDEQIEEVSLQIETTPDSAYLYFYRGKLKCQHEEYVDALADLEHASDLGYQDVQLLHFSARVLFQLKKYHLALEAVQAILAKTPNNVTALKTRAKILSADGQFESSAKTHQLVIEHSIRTFPVNYLDAAQAWLDSEVKDAKPLALETLNRGIQDLGPTLTLYERKKEIHLTAKDFRNAMFEQQEIIARSNRKEVPFFQAAEISILLGDHLQAIKLLTSTRTAILNLPSEIRSTAAMQLLDRQSRIFLTELKSPTYEVH